MLSYHINAIARSPSVFCRRVLQKRRRKEQGGGDHPTVKCYLDTAEEPFKSVSADDNLCFP